MNLSKQQMEILDISKELNMNQVLKINAFAGTGKTTTLNLIANSLKDKSFLYLAFNNDIVKEAKRKFDNNVYTVTVNSLAYKKVIGEKGYCLSKIDFSPIFVSEVLKVDFSDAYDVLKIYTLFCNSDFKSINDTKNLYIPKRINAFEYAREFYKKIEEKDIECDHSFYLKEYELGKYATSLNFDYILLDEAQDTNSVTLSIFSQLKGRKILVGDTHQTIYQFRGSVNAMETIQSDYNCYLSTTYRCNENVVAYANAVLNKFKKEKVKLISGVKEQDKTINEIAYITRSNSEIINLIQELDDFDCSKKIDDIFGLSLAIYKTFLSEKKSEFESSKFEFLNKFDSLKTLKEYSEKINDVELSGAIRNAERYKGYLFVLYMKAKLKNKSSSKNKLTTAHKSKGLEYDEIKICKDFRDPNKCETMPEYVCEANLLYVTLTRARKKITFIDERILDVIF